MAKNYAVIDQQNGLSQVTGRPYTKITLVDIDTRQQYPTYADTANHNCKNWQQIISHPQRGYILTGLTVVTRKGKTVIDADCDPVIVSEFDDCHELDLAIKKMWREVDSERTQQSSQGCKNKFNDLFE
jgi:hypothetical protein